MDKGLRAETKLRIDEVADLAQRLHDNPQASKFERSTWLHGVEDRLQLLRNVLGVALGDGGTPVNEVSSLDEQLPDWDRETSVIAAEKGISEQMVEAVKVSFENKGYTLKFPSDPKYHDPQWHLVHGGLPADWEERIRTGQPLS